ncbi:MAG: diiron oxygenase [Alcanivoracaceae bacterium]|nr:diiron oxygenase [Alcanivoracaceae bacterium]
MKNTSLPERANKLIQLSIDNHIYAFNYFQWPDTLPENEYWFSPDALSIANSAVEKELTEEQKIKLSKWECINSFSLNNSGERELIHEVSRVMHELPIGESKEYLHHLIDEENQHMWYFNKFCNQYAGKVYTDKKLQLKKEKTSKVIDHFLVFARVLIFEEIGHYYNIMNSKDERVNQFVRQINKAHYSEEARHITFGRHLLTPLAEQALSSEESTLKIKSELNKSIQMNINSLYNPSMYRDAGLEKPMLIRSRLLEDENRKLIHQNTILKGIKKVFAKLELDLNVNV